MREGRREGGREQGREKEEEEKGGRGKKRMKEAWLCWDLFYVLILI